jgi:thiamine biosynthesis lipoprotein
VKLRCYRFRAMGSPCALHLYGRNAERVAGAAIAEVERLERKYSRYRADSVASRINRSAGTGQLVEVDDETASLLDYAATCHRESEGLFDITSGVLRRAWDFKAARVPSQSEIDVLLERIGWSKLHWRSPRLRLPSTGMELDFGGYVKEYAADRTAELCRRLGVQHGLVDLGGDLAVVGAHPDGGSWKVGVRDPSAPATPSAVVELRAGAIASSGDYERFMIVDGKRYGHILNPSTGWPVEGLASVSVLAPHCLVAGSASTIAMLMGERKGIRWLAQLGLPHVFVTRGGRRGGSLSPRDEPGQAGQRLRRKGFESEGSDQRFGAISSSGAE